MRSNKRPANPAFCLPTNTWYRDYLVTVFLYFKIVGVSIYYGSTLGTLAYELHNKC
jgi:hypothetical protein